MGFSDEREKLRLAEEWLRDCRPDDIHYVAAWEHITHVLTWTADPELRTEAQRIADKALTRGFYRRGLPARRQP
jgi:hypothetical protein